jgi:hypothetical protein
MADILKFPETKANTEPIIDGDYFGFSETIPITELIMLLEKQRAGWTDIKDKGVDNSEDM